VIPASNRVAVRCRGITKNFAQGGHATRALECVDLELRLGEITFIVGPSGSGKTTLLSIIGGILSADDGELDVLGVPLRQLRAVELVRFRAVNVGFVFQQFNLIPSLTAVENAALPLIIAGRNERAANAMASELLCRLGLQPQLSMFPRDMSVGQQQRISIARALVHSPRLVVSDEPTAALDADSSHVVMDILRNLAVTDNRAVLVVTHDSRIFRTGDRVLRMEDGRMVLGEDV
jgi:putative ABC transport system ATP-binding protein